MKEFIARSANFVRVEFWAVTTIFVFIIFFHITDAVTGDIRFNSSSNNTPFNYLFVAKLLRYTVLYLCFLFLNFTVVPRMVKKEKLVLQSLLVVILYLVVSVLFGIKNSLLKEAMISGYQLSNAENNIAFQNSFLYVAWLLLVFGLYWLSNIAAGTCWRARKPCRRGTHLLRQVAWLYL